MATIIDDASVHQVAAWCREGHGVWYVHFVVNGYDEDFVMREPGKLSEGFVEKLTQMKLARALKVSPSHVIHRQTVKES